jgi:RHS repeat-associated protein
MLIEIECGTGVSPVSQTDCGTGVPAMCGTGVSPVSQTDCGTGVPPVSDAVMRQNTWGLDLAGQAGDPSPSQGEGLGEGFLASAGGIGGLLAVHDTRGTESTGDDLDGVCTPLPPREGFGGGSHRSNSNGQVPLQSPLGRRTVPPDANGNVGQVVDLTATTWSSAAITAHYEYAPYGGVTNTISGYAYAEENPWRFSTKQWDPETALGYWGRRYYSATLGRWMNEDPIEERGGVNLYAYAGNQPIHRYDARGLTSAYLLPPEGVDWPRPSSDECPRRGQRSKNGQAPPTRKSGKKTSGTPGPPPPPPPPPPPDPDYLACKESLESALEHVAVQDLLQQLKQEGCGTPNITCDPNPNAPGSPCIGDVRGGYSGKSRDITMCRGHSAANLAHELTHALQDCRRRKTASNPNMVSVYDIACMEYQAYACEAFVRGDSLDPVRLREQCAASTFFALRGLQKYTEEQQRNMAERACTKASGDPDCKDCSGILHS